MRIYNIHHIISTGFILFIGTVKVFSQENTLHFMHLNPQVIHTNPALFHICRTYIELPAISSVRYSYGNSGFGYHDAFRYGTGTQGDSIMINIDNLDRKMRNRNYIRNDYSVNILGAGFRIKEYFFHFNISSHGESRIGLPGDLIALKDGNWDSSEEVPRDINLDGLGAHALNYIQFAAGISKKIGEGYSIGFTAKYLMGSASLITRRSVTDIDTQADPIVLNVSSKYKIYSSFPVDISYDNLGIVQTVDFSHTLSDPVQDFIFNKNRGLALDAGILYDYSDDITLSASLIDLGFIRWKSNINRFESEGSFTFQGFDLMQYSTGTDETELFQTLLDSIQDSWQFVNNNDPFFSLLTPKIYLGGLYQLNKKIAFGALVRTEIFDRRPHFALTLSANFTPVNFFSGTVSYSIMNNKLYQLGLGFSLGGPGVQLFFVSDHIPIRFVREVNTGILFPYNARTINFRVGINLIFGCRDMTYEGKPPAYHYRRPRKLCPAYD
jgi:hypothetical protein